MLFCVIFNYSHIYIKGDMMAYKMTEEHKRKISEALKGKYKGVSHIERYGKETADMIRESRNEKLTGRKRAPFSDEWKENMSKSRKDPNSDYQKWMKSDEYRETRRRIAVENQTDVSYEDWLSKLGEKDLYYHKVMKHTKKQPIHLLDDYDKRGNSKNDGYHLDHIKSISYGFHNDIPAEEIGDISNLRFIHWLDNVKKGSNCEI
jgi:hypothetical protein